jgi:hypothetical protein
MVPGNNQMCFILLCVGERRSQYENALEGLPCDVVMVDGILPLLSSCVQMSPQAVLVDALSAARMGAALVNPLFEMRMAWPIMRCTLRPDGTVAVICTSPARQGTLSEVIASIASGDCDWLPPWHRRSIRVDVLWRMRIRHRGEESWRHANSLNVSRGGAFVVAYEDYTLEDGLDLELWDISEKPARVQAKVARLRRWDDGPGLPGIGVSFEPGSIPCDFGQVIVAQLSAKMLRL